MKDRLKFILHLLTPLLLVAGFLLRANHVSAGSFNIWDTSTLIGPAVSQWQFLSVSEDGNYITGTTSGGRIYIPRIRG